MGPREAARLRPAMGFGDQSACFRRSRNEERSDLRLGCHELRPREKRKDRRANNSFKPTPFRCVACVRSLRSHTSPHRSRRGLTQALERSHETALLGKEPSVLGKAQAPGRFSVLKAALRSGLPTTCSRRFRAGRVSLRQTRTEQGFAVRTQSRSRHHAPRTRLRARGTSLAWQPIWLGSWQ